MRTLYIDASNSGLSGDMFLAALLKLVPDPDVVIRLLNELKYYLSGVNELKIKLQEVNRFGLSVAQMNIIIKENKSHRTVKELKSSLHRFLDEKELTSGAKDYAKSVLESLISAEAEVHGKSMDKIHLHELSSVDTLIDILGVTMSLDQLDIFNPDVKIMCSKIPLGKGSIKIAHGIVPIPAPATAKILKRSDLIVFNGPVKGELITPTGAALLTNLKPTLTNMEMVLNNISYSTGEKEFKDFPNILALYYGNKDEKYMLGAFEKYLEPVIVLETNVDDISGELIGDFINRLPSEDILDVQIIPSLTKKNRPAHLIQLLCNLGKEESLIKKLFADLGTLGVRIKKLNRICVERKVDYLNINIDNKRYTIDYKISYIDLENERQIINIKPEYESLKKISEATKKSVREIQSYVSKHLLDIRNKEINKKNNN
ncbi:MAG: nickel pincer cofactor biosynthesis protein LarC [Promethearchaeota archaeon]